MVAVDVLGVGVRKPCHKLQDTAATPMDAHANLCKALGQRVRSQAVAFTRVPSDLLALFWTNTDFPFESPFGR